MYGTQIRTRGAEVQSAVPDELHVDEDLCAPAVATVFDAERVHRAERGDPALERRSARAFSF